jgi:hypothetical protein
MQRNFFKINLDPFEVYTQMATSKIDRKDRDFGRQYNIGLPFICVGSTMVPSQSSVAVTSVAIMQDTISSVPLNSFASIQRRGVRSSICTENKYVSRAESEISLGNLDLSLSINHLHKEKLMIVCATGIYNIMNHADALPETFKMKIMENAAFFENLVNGMCNDLNDARDKHSSLKPRIPEIRVPETPHTIGWPSMPSGRIYNNISSQYKM